MKKILSLIIVLSMAIVCCACGEKAVLSDTDSLSKTDNDVESTTAKTVSEIEQTTVDYRSLSNEDFAQKVAEDFSTKDVSFSIRKTDDNIIFLDANGTDDIDLFVGFSDYGNHIMMSFITDKSEDECYYVLLQALKSDLFGISIDDQIDILAHYTVDKIDYKNDNIRISETDKENIVTIGFRF